jgi:hypothetical protein
MSDSAAANLGIFDGFWLPGLDCVYAGKPMKKQHIYSSSFLKASI